MEIACNAMEIAAKQTLCEEACLEACRGKPRGETGLEAVSRPRGYGNCHRMLWKLQQRRDLARMRELPLMLWKVHLAREIAMDAIESGAKQTLG